MRRASYAEWFINKIRKEDYHQLQPPALARAISHACRDILSSVAMVCRCRMMTKKMGVI
jgi:hypothetical protein